MCNIYYNINVYTHASTQTRTHAHTSPPSETGVRDPGETCRPHRPVGAQVQLAQRPRRQVRVRAVLLVRDESVYQRQHQRQGECPHQTHQHLQIQVNTGKQHQRQREHPHQTHQHLEIQVNTGKQNHPERGCPHQTHQHPEIQVNTGKQNHPMREHPQQTYQHLEIQVNTGKQNDPERQRTHIKHTNTWKYR